MHVSCCIWLLGLVSLGLAASNAKQHYERQNNGGDKTVDLEVVNDKAIIRVTSGPSSGSIVVIELVKGVLSWFNVATDKCYLVGGIDDKVPSMEKLPQILEDDEAVDMTGNEVTYEMKRQKAMATSVLAEEVKNVCGDKPVNWLQNGQQERGRVKRGAWGCGFGCHCECYA